MLIGCKLIKFVALVAVVPITAIPAFVLLQPWPAGFTEMLGVQAGFLLGVELQLAGFRAASA